MPLIPDHTRRRVTPVGGRPESVVVDDGKAARCVEQGLEILNAATIEASGCVVL
jgi:hypothetical protein